MNFLRTLAQTTENSGTVFGAQHYEFDGLYATKSDGTEIPYIPATGNVVWNDIGSTGFQNFQNFFFDNEIPVSNSPFPDAPYTFDVVAHWTTKEYTINLNTNGGTYGNTGERFIKEKWVN